jgi:protease-4
MPTSIVGGIGVILNMYNLADSLTRYDIHDAAVKSGENIDIGSQLRPASDDQRAWLQGLADWYHSRFKEVVMKSRPTMSPDQAEIFDGRIFTGAQAVQWHIVDSLGFPDDAVQAARGMAGLGDSRVVFYRRCNDRARSIYSITPNVPLQGQVVQMNSPGLDRASLPTFLYLWEPEPTIERQGGR